MSELPYGNRPLKRLIVAPHADDEALGCGGLLAKYRTECAVVVLAAPDDVRAKEFDAAQLLLGYRESLCLGLTDGYIGTDMHHLVGQLDVVVRRLQPQFLYLPYPSVHQDHVAAYEAGVRTARMSMNANHWFTPSVLVYDVAAYDVNLYPTDLRWNYFEVLTEAQVDAKVAAIALYASQKMVGPHPANSVKQAALSLGGARRVQYAEQYALVRQVQA